QGSVNSIHARGLDFGTPFDTTSTGDGVFTPLVFTNISVATPSGTNANVDNVTDYTVDYTLLVDVMATPATTDVNIHSGPAVDSIAFPAPQALPIVARTPTALTAGTLASATIAKLGDSSLFSYTPASSALKIVDFTLSSADANAQPAAYFLPKSGKFADLF